MVFLLLIHKVQFSRCCHENIIKVCLLQGNTKTNEVRKLTFGNGNECNGFVHHSTANKLNMFKCCKNVICFRTIFLFFRNYVCTLEFFQEFFLQITKPQVNQNGIHHCIRWDFFSSFFSQLASNQQHFFYPRFYHLVCLQFLGSIVFTRLDWLTSSLHKHRSRRITINKTRFND